ncbi:MAG TPA: pyrroline-5-carboxylate reductase [Thermoanaerobaculia bacterium]|nr:pyrroline-5-carboxylate reductase [Thermoanaerobaculia bacterium]
MLRDLTFAFVGAGTMGEAMIAGLLKKQLVSPERILATTPRAERREALAAKHGIRTSADNRAAAAEADVVVVAFKPQMLPQVLPTLRGAISPQAMVISVIAGATVATFREVLGHEAIVRAMPNTPSQIDEGMTVWTATPAVTPRQREMAAEMLGALGKEHYVADEKFVDMAAALSGTAPAYCFLLLEALVDAGVHLGFSRRVAEELVLQAIHGSVLLAMQSGQHLAELRNMVTSPGGASAAALYALEKGGLRTVMADGVWASYRRVQELGKGDTAPAPVPPAPG